MDENQITDGSGSPTPSFPPAGWVRREDVARMFGISSDTLNRWYGQGLIRFGRKVAKPDRGWCKIYPIDELQRLMERMRAEQGKLPEGFVGRAEAARMFNLSLSGWKKWRHRPRVPAGQWVSVPGQRSLVKIYPLDGLRRLREELEAIGELRPDADQRQAIKARRAAAQAAKRPPAGMIRQRAARRMFGASRGVWKHWRRKGWVRGAKYGPNWYYDEAELRRLLAENGRLGPAYPDPRLPGVYRVPVRTKTMRCLEALVDADDVHLVRGRRWNWSEGTLYGGFVVLSHRTKPVALRRIIADVRGRGIVVGHANGDRLDCRRANLVVRTMKNLARSNRKMGSVNGHEYTSQFKGVSWDERTGRWLVQIRVDGVGRVVGRFHDEIAAAQAYDEAARELFGEHARLNFPDGVDAWLEAEAMRTERAEAA